MLDEVINASLPSSGQYYIRVVRVEEAFSSSPYTLRLTVVETTLTPTATPTITLTPTITPTFTTATIRDGTVGNVHDTGLSISWLTDQVTWGFVRYPQAGDSGLGAAFDVRGQWTFGYTHYVDLSDLAAETTYEYQVQSGLTVMPGQGGFYTVTTGASLEVPSLAPSIRGRGVITGTDEPADGALIYLEILDDDNQGSPGESALLSGIASATGNWLIPLLGRTTAGDAYFEYSCAATDKVRIKAFHAPGQAESATYNLSIVDPFRQLGDVGNVHLLEDGEELISLRPGWSFIGLRVKRLDGLSNEELLTLLQAGGVDAGHIIRWQFGRWEIHVRGWDFGIWPVEVSKGYFVRVSGDGGIVSLTGKQMVYTPKLEIITVGWHALSVPYSDRPLDSPALIDILAEQGVDVLLVVKWEGGRLARRRQRLGCWHVAGPARQWLFRQGYRSAAKLTRTKSKWLEDLSIDGGPQTSGARHGRGEAHDSREDHPAVERAGRARRRRITWPH